jgi:hypothetical protein
MKHIAFAASVTALALAGNAGTSVAQAKQKFVEIQIAGAVNVYAGDINDNGDVTGYFTDSSGASHGFLRAADGTITTFDVPGASSTSAFSINNADQIAGDSSLNLGFLREPDGTITNFGVKGATDTFVSAINKKGVVAGGYATDNTQYGMLRHKNGKIQKFNPPNSYIVVTTDLNSSGTVTGYYYDIDFHHIGFTRTSDGTFEEFSITQDAPYTEPHGINSAGWIAGRTEAIQGGPEGFLRDPEGSSVTFNPFSQPNVWVTDLNDNNWVIGYTENGQLTGAEGFVRLPDGTFIAVNDPNAGERGTHLFAINKAGTVAGTYQDSSEVAAVHSFIVRVKP